jgi:2-C-methyl-D-erythritol 4-phosphate cytidylyltransferase/2-C-methyl-D-erythritol 2,4-cyclodiphosphate synthase
LLDITLIVLCAGNSTRFELQPKKQWLRCKDEPLWLNVTNKLSSYANFDNVIVTGHKDELNYMKNYSDHFTFVSGGNTRQESILNALQKVTTSFVMISDVARCCIPKSIVLNLIKNKDKASCIVPYLNVSDTVVYNDKTINRDEVKLIQTPQLSNTKKLKDAISKSENFTDESSAFKNIDENIFYIKGSTEANKLTFGNELSKISCLEAPSPDTFIGNGIDIHPFEQNKQMVLGGVHIPCEYGFKAHSDGDVLIHSIIDSLLGAIGAGDIGEFFPDTDSKYKGVDSKELLTHIVNFVTNVGYEIVNIDVTIIAQIPRINPHKDNIKSKLSKLINIPKYKINIKATTAEKLGFIGREEAVAVQSTASLKYYNWTK